MWAGAGRCSRIADCGTAVMPRGMLVFRPTVMGGVRRPVRCARQRARGASSEMNNDEDCEGRTWIYFCHVGIPRMRMDS